MTYHPPADEATKGRTGPRRTLRCLLLSPVSPPDPNNGDAQFTRDLLREPPDGVEYVPYTDAIDTGTLVEGPSIRQPGRWRAAPRHVPSSVPRAALHVLRRAGWLLPDPVRWLQVIGSFDLVHVHCFPVRFLGPHPPVVVSDSAGTFWYWTAARGMPAARVDKLLRRERRVAETLGYLHPTARPDPAGRTLLFVDAGRPLLERIGADTARVGRCPPGVPTARRSATSDGRTLLFVARDFTLKGGRMVLDVFDRLRRDHPRARLLVAGSAEPDPSLDGVEWIGPVTREALYERVYPRADVFLYPTKFDCAPLVVMEALAHGLPVVAPRAFALPELVRDGVTGLLHEPDDAEGAAAAVHQLLSQPGWRGQMSTAARDDHAARFSVEERNHRLERAYRGLTA